MSTIEDESVHLILTSPPYNLGKEYECQQTVEAYVGEQRRTIAECVRVLHPRGSLCWQVGNYVADGIVHPIDTMLHATFAAHGLQLRNRIIWHYRHGQHARRRLSGRYETINWWTKTDGYTWHLDPIRVPQRYPDKRHHKESRRGELSGNPRGKNPGDVWDIPSVKSNHVEKTAHPCQFPVELAERLVLALSDPGDIVLDPHVGSGSTIIAATMHERVGWGCDLEPSYVEIAKDRLQQLADGDLRVRPMSRLTLDPEQRARVAPPINAGQQAIWS